MDIRQELYEKASREQEEFINKLMTSEPKTIIEASYEKVIKDDILILLEDNILSDEQVLILSKLEYPLKTLYGEWLNNDFSHMDYLLQTIENFCQRLY